MAIVGLVTTAGGAFFMFGGSHDFAPLVAGRLTSSLARKVTIGSLQVTPGRWLRVELRDFHVANLPNGTQPVMATVTSASAEISAISLLHGPIVVRSLTINGLQLLLERTADDKKNWKFAEATQGAPPKPFDRTRFPTLLDAHIKGDVVFRTSSDRLLETHLDDLHLHAGAADKPVRLAGRGSYNGALLTLEADLAPLDALRDAGTPYAANIRLTSSDTTLQFRGTMAEPLDIDGAKGLLTLVAPTAAAILQIASLPAPGAFNASFQLAGPFEHDGPLWHLSQASGRLNDDRIIAADIKLIEGSRGKPDDLSVDLAFDHLNANALLAAKTTGHDADIPLSVDLAPDTLITAKMTARDLSYAGIRASDVTFGGFLKPGRITVDVLSLGYLGTPFRASGQIEPLRGPRSKGGGHVTANVDMNRMDVQALSRLLAAGDLPLLGRVDGKILMEATGSTLNQAAREARLSAVFAMDSGSVSRRIIELASTDARTIFRKAAGMSPISCLIAVLDIRGGTGTISPLRIRSADGTITGRGTFDIYRHQFDITVASEARTTGPFALDVPVHLSGSFTSPTIAPATLSAAGRAELAAGDDVSRLLAQLQSFARHSPCLSARAG